MLFLKGKFSYGPALSALLLIGSLAAVHAGEVEFIQSEATKSAGLPFSDVVRVGDLLFLSGQIGAVPSAATLTLAEGGIEAETRQAMDNIGTALSLAGAGFEDVVKCSVFLADVSEWAVFNKVYLTFFEGLPPARSAFGANGLAGGARVEIECIAALAD